MSSNNFFPAVTSIHLHTQKDSQELILYKDQNNTLNISCTIGGLTRRTLPYIHESLDYVAIWFTLYHQFGGKETTIVRRYVVEYDPNQGDINEDTEQIKFEIPIDDDFSNLDFISNYYYLQIGFTNKKTDQMGVTESIISNTIFKTKIPFNVLTNKVV
ncbi:hypothetical protein RGU74_07725 [Bacillus cereus]|uniref:hypothetical protein n=1 Tax=Bacillus TaxID=1386 RepID=UPI000CFA89EF|nr:MULTISPECIES: hypothetical protein [Bacillus]MDR4983593.1 hypothetical protein [Bacillus cereus]PQZ57357.1 hypothetical protein CQZ94_11040 [Bacillus sp. MYb209]PRT14496.1 hypothetical protein C6353_23950 [Bacillus toyonensis]